ncbi:hypothetical protein C3Y87_01585 [Carbonactinospora thermoautotrophica]|nr:hypothetical protein [Carbonactinospora thermoautotrophica]
MATWSASASTAAPASVTRPPGGSANRIRSCPARSPVARSDRPPAPRSRAPPRRTRSAISASRRSR